MSDTVKVGSLARDSMPRLDKSWNGSTLNPQVLGNAAATADADRLRNQVLGRNNPWNQGVQTFQVADRGRSRGNNASNSDSDAKKSDNNPAPTVVAPKGNSSNPSNTGGRATRMPQIIQPGGGASTTNSVVVPGNTGTTGATKFNKGGSNSGNNPIVGGSPISGNNPTGGKAPIGGTNPVGGNNPIIGGNPAGGVNAATGNNPSGGSPLNGRNLQGGKKAWSGANWPGNNNNNPFADRAPVGGNALSGRLGSDGTTPNAAGVSNGLPSNQTFDPNGAVGRLRQRGLELNAANNNNNVVGGNPGSGVNRSKPDFTPGKNADGGDDNATPGLGKPATELTLPGHDLPSPGGANSGANGGQGFDNANGNTFGNRRGNGNNFAVGGKNSGGKNSGGNDSGGNDNASGNAQGNPGKPQGRFGPSGKFGGVTGGGQGMENLIDAGSGKGRGPGNDSSGKGELSGKGPGNPQGKGSGNNTGPNQGNLNGPKFNLGQGPGNRGNGDQGNGKQGNFDRGNFDRGNFDRGNAGFTPGLNKSQGPWKGPKGDFNPGDGGKHDFHARFEKGDFDHVVKGHIGKQIDLDHQYKFAAQGDVARRLKLHEHGDWSDKINNVVVVNNNTTINRLYPDGRKFYHGRIYDHYDRDCFQYRYWGPSWFAGIWWYPRWGGWVDWSWGYNCNPWWDPRPIYCRPIYYEPAPVWVYYQVPVFVPLAATPSGTWVDVQRPAIVPEQFDLQLLAVRFVDPGHPDEQLGPRYRIWYRNNSDRPIDHPFNVTVLAGNDAQWAADLPQAGVRVAAMDAGDTQSVDVRLPINVLNMNRDPQGNPTAFQTLHVLVDANREVSDVNRTNNGANISRDDILSVDPAAFGVQPEQPQAGGEVVIAGEGFGPAPGRVLVQIGGLELDATILGWYDLGVRVQLPALMLAAPTDAQLVVIRGDSAAANPVTVQVSPPQ